MTSKNLVGAKLYISLAVIFGFIFGVFMGGLVGTVADEVPDRMSSYDHVSEEEIMLVGNDMYISFNDKDMKWSKFENTNSMDPLLDEGYNGFEFIPKSEDDIYLGDVVSFEYEGSIMIHRVVEMGEDENGWYALTKGDNLEKIDYGKRRFKDIKGVLVGVIF